MTAFSLIAVLLTLTAVLAYLNARFLRLPATVGLMALSLVFSLLMLGAGELGLPLRYWALSVIGHIDFSKALLNGMLSFLLFAGALHCGSRRSAGTEGHDRRFGHSGRSDIYSVGWGRKLAGLQVARPWNIVDRLSHLRRLDLAHRSNCSHGVAERIQCSCFALDQDRWRVAV